VELHLHSPNTSSWRGAQLKKRRDNFTFFNFICRVARDVSVTVNWIGRNVEKIGRGLL
jgi:hypothetical protein